MIDVLAAMSIAALVGFESPPPLHSDIRYESAGAYQTTTLPSENEQPVSRDAKAVLERARRSVFRIDGYAGSDSAPAFHGTGFAVGEAGLGITNYHVVAEAVRDAEKYELRYETEDGKSGSLEVLAVDVPNDLALVRANGLAAPALRFAAASAKGETIYAVGYPHDVGLTITEGISNGQTRDSYVPRIHYSGALNAGMSGGPAFDGDGGIVGINVSSRVYSQLVNFLVPSAAAINLLEQHENNSDSLENDKQGLLSSVGEQSRNHSRTIVQTLTDALSSQEFFGYRLPGKPAPYFTCNTARDGRDDAPYEAISLSCESNSSIYIEQGLQAGSIRFNHSATRSDKLGAWRYAKHHSSNASGLWVSGSRKHSGPFDCEDQVVQLNGFHAKALFCARARRDIDGLFDVVFRIVSLDGDQRGFVSTLRLDGVEYEPALNFARAYIETMEYKP